VREALYPGHKILEEERLDTMSQTTYHISTVKICRRGEEMEAAASLYYSSIFDLIQTAKYIG
jgi:hypothetical protein